MLCLFITMNCAACFCFHAMYRQPAPWCHPVAVISRTLWEFLSMNIVCMWLLFVGNKLYGEKAGTLRSVFDHKHTKIRFLRIAPMVLSVFLSLLPQFFTPYNTGILGFVIGVTLLYFSMIGEINYVDTASGWRKRNS